MDSNRGTCDRELEAAARAHPDASIVFTGARPATVTVAEVRRRALRVAAGLGRLGVRPGDAVSVQLPNWAECLIAYEAVLAAGAVLVPIVHIYGVAEVDFILRQSMASVHIQPSTWRSTDYGRRVERLLEIDTLNHVVSVGGDSTDTSWQTLEDTAADGGIPTAHSDDPAMIVYTSGTTADPKGVVHSHRSLLAEVMSMPSLLGGRPDDRILLTFPAGHVAGVHSLLRPLLRGTTTVVMDSWDAAEAAAIIGRHGITATAGAPIHLQTMLDAARDTRHLTSLREYLVGAAPVPNDLVGRANEMGITTFRSYGSTEHPTITCGSPDDTEEKRLRTEGRPCPGTEVRIVDETGADVPVGSDGEVVCRGPEQFLGYRDPALNVGAWFDGGWLRTGDVGHLDDAGYLCITDRIKDVIVRGGETISSQQVENALRTHPSVLDVAVVGVPDPIFGEAVCAIVVLRPNSVLDPDALRAHVTAAGLARAKTPRHIVDIAEFPRTPLGKIKKGDLRGFASRSTTVSGA